MINANELRIGNWIAVKGVPVLVDNINDAGINGVFDSRWAEYGTEEIDPIPLTSKILLAVGFELTDDVFHNRYRKSDGRAIYEFCIREQYGIDNANCGIMGVAYDEKDIDNWDGTTYHQEYSWNGFAWRIKYLHQLQNLYFALTGQELIYKP